MEPIHIIKIDESNYSKFDDLVYWRLNKIERPENTINLLEKDWGGVLTVLNNPNLHLYAAEKDDKFVGWISIVYIPKLGRWKHFGHLYVDELWVEPSSRNQGIASKLMEMVDRLYDEVKVDGIRLYVSMNNPSAKGLYEKFGFKVCDEAYFMEKK